MIPSEDVQSHSKELSCLKILIFLCSKLIYFVVSVILGFSVYFFLSFFFQSAIGTALDERVFHTASFFFFFFLHNDDYLY